MNFLFLQIDNPFQLMVFICLIFIYFWALGFLFPERRWIGTYGGAVHWEENYYWDIWLPGKIKDLESGLSEDEYYGVDDLPVLKKHLEDHLSGKDLI